MSKHLFFAPEPPVGLAKQGVMEYNFVRKRRKEARRIYHIRGHAYRTAGINSFACTIGYLEKIQPVAEEGYDCATANEKLRE